jgi:hypothetical protein
MEQHPPAHVPRYVPARTNEGWPIAGLVVAIAIVCIIGVVIIHQRTYKHPTDPGWHAVGGGPPATRVSH